MCTNFTYAALNCCFFSARLVYTVIISLQVSALSAGEGYEKIVFLYQLEQGQAGKSYGLNVAALAGLDSAILKLAAQKSRELENQCVRGTRAGSHTRLEREEVLRHIVTRVQQQLDSLDPEAVVCMAKKVLL